MRQRVVIALALCAEPELIIADEPTTALDVSVQAQIIALLKTLAADHGTAMMLITHDMGVIAETADRVAVMYAGRIAEIGPVREVVKRANHPYTAGLMGSIPSLDQPIPSASCRFDGCDAAADRDPARLRLQPALPDRCSTSCLVDLRPDPDRCRRTPASPAGCTTMPEVARSG
jgi:peptide/nickel transport system ATP-binding protein